MNPENTTNWESASEAMNFFDQLRLKQEGVEPSQTHSDDNEDALAISPEPATVNSDNERLPIEARRAVVSLLKYGVILAAQKNKLFNSVCRHQQAIRNHLLDIFLKLVLDEKMGVAFVTRLDEGDDENDDSVSLITRRTLSLYDTLLLLVLRKHFQERESAGEQRIIIDMERLEANLSPFLPLTNSSKADRRKLNAAVKKMSEKHILSQIRGSEDRYEITPIIRYVVNAEFLEHMLAEYQRLAMEAGVNLQNDEDNDE